MSTLIVRSLDLRTCWLVVALLGFLATPAISVGSPALPQMQATAQAAEEAGLHRPPDLEDLWLTVLLKMAPSTPPFSGGYGSTRYVSVSTGGEKLRRDVRRLDDIRRISRPLGLAHPF